MEHWGAQMSKNKKSVLPLIRLVEKNSKYYSDTEDQIKNLHHFTPSSECDERQRNLFQDYVDNKEVLMVVEGDDLSRLAKATHPLYKFAQTRITGTDGFDGTGAKQYYKDFYLTGIKQDRIIHACLWNGLLWVHSGNKRARGHEIGIGKGHESKCNLLVVDLSDLSEIQFKRRISDWGELSNRQTHWTRPEPPEDLVHQVMNKWHLVCEENPERYNNYTEEQKLSWAKAQFIVRNEKYALDTMKTKLSTLANQCFASHIGQVITHDKDWSDAPELYSRYFPGSWSTENIHARMRFMPSGKQSVKRIMTEWWSKQPVGQNDSHPHYFILRAGTTYSSPLTSLETVTEERKDVMKALTEYNQNPRHCAAKYPKVQRVIWVHQIKDLTEPEAWEWDEAEQAFVRREEARNG
jgi:hypothetical protein